VAEHTGGAASAAHAHPTIRQYIVVAVILTIITAVEVAVFYIHWFGVFVYPILFVLSASKFVLVGAYYMHLKYDPPVMTWLFVGGLVIATATIGGLWALFNGFGG